MSETAQTSETPPAKRKNSVQRWMAGIVLLLFLSAVGVYTFWPSPYTATGWIRICSRQPHFLIKEGNENFSSCVQTQIDLMGSPPILESALRMPEVANLPSVMRQRDKVAWLQKKLKIRRQGDSEILTVSLSLPQREKPDKIVNAVLEAYFEFYEASLVDRNSQLMAWLHTEQTRQHAAAEKLREEMRGLRKSVAKEKVKKGTEMDVDLITTAQEGIEAKAVQLKRVSDIIDQIQNCVTVLATERYAPRRVQLLKYAVAPTASDSCWAMW